MLHEFVLDKGSISIQCGILIKDFNGSREVDAESLDKLSNFAKAW